MLENNVCEIPGTCVLDAIMEKKIWKRRKRDKKSNQFVN
jgi:hypothetical protein